MRQAKSSPEPAKRLVALCFIPELGHVAPLLRIAREARDAGFLVRAVVPREAEPMIQRYGLEADFIGSVTPSGAEGLRADMVRTSGTVFYPSAARRFENRYWVPLLLSLGRRAGELAVRVAAFRPSVAVSDSHVCGWLYRAAAPSIPHLVHVAAGSHFGCQETGVMEPGRLPRILARARHWRDRVVYTGLLRMGRLFRQEEWKEDRRHRDELDRIRNRILADTPPTPEVTAATGMGVLEEELLGHRIRPCPGVHAFGSLDPGSGAELDHDLLEWLEASQEPVVLVSFGSVVPSGTALAGRVLDGLSEAEVRILWVGGRKGAQNIDQPRGSRLRREVFLPQPEVLGHPRVRVFVTHAGSGGVQDGIWNGKPILALPILSDEPYNARVIEAMGAGLCIPARSVSASGISRSVRYLLEDPGFTLRAQELSDRMRRKEGGRRIRELLHRILENPEGMTFNG